MCGIFGAVGKVRFRPDEISASLRHRGPDDEGWVVIKGDRVIHAKGRDTIGEFAHLPPVEDVMEGGEVLLHSRRLKIIDLSPAGHQPMEYDGLVMVFNGEIYNYLEIREALEGEGYTFGSGSDTEVLLKAFHRWGADVLHRLNGMWAFAIYDTRERRLFLARDRFGKKPLYYILKDGGFVFASEVKALLKTSLSTKNFNTKEVVRFLVYSDSDMNEDTIFYGINRVLPSHYAIFDLKNGDLKITRYYDIDVEERRIGFEEAKGTFISLFDSAVKLRLRSDVKTGTSLSGGLDSSSIVAFAVRSGHPNFSYYAFSILHSSFPKYDEREYIREVVKSTGINWVYIESDRNFLRKNVRKFVYHQEEPVGTLSPFAQFSVYTLPRKYGVIVLLDGQGGDETLGGYLRYVPIFLLERLLRFDILSVLKELWHFRKSNISYTKTFLRAALNFLGPKALFLWRSKEIFSTPPPYVPPPSKTRDRVMSLSEKLKSDIMDNISTLLRYADKNSSAFSLEVRSPYLDYRLVEFLLSLPSDYKIRDGFTKYLAREAFKGILPDRVVWRRDKLGFPFPQEAFIGRDDYLAVLRRSKILKWLKVKEDVPPSLWWRVMNVGLIEEVFGL